MQATSAPWVVGDDVYVAHRGPGSRRRERRPPRAARPVPEPQTDALEEEPLERIARLKSERGVEAGAFAFKSAAYLLEKHGAARKAAFVAEDVGVGFANAPASAKMHYANSLIGRSGSAGRGGSRGRGRWWPTECCTKRPATGWRRPEISSGRVLWTWGDARAMEGERRLTPVAANGRVLLGTWDGRLVSLEAASGTVRWDVCVGAPVHWQPTMSGGRVFAGLEDGSVVCVETGDPGDDGWAMWAAGRDTTGAFESCPIGRARRR